MAKDMNNLLTMHNKNDLTTHKAENVTSGNPHGIDAKANKVQEDWITPTLLNGWEPYANTHSQPAYYKDQFGVVHLRGMVKRTSGVGTQLLTLPVGYRPEKTSYFVGTRSGSDACRIAVLDIGSVYLETSSNVWTSIDGITFKAGV